MHKPAFPNPCLADNVHDLCFAFFYLFECGSQGVQLRMSANQFGKTPNKCCFQSSMNVSSLRDHAEDWLRLGFALKGNFPHGLGFKIVLDHTVRFFTHPNFARVCCLFYTGGKVCGVSVCRIVHSKIISDGTYNNRSGVKAHTHLEFETVFGLNLMIVSFKTPLYAQGGVAGPLGVVFVSKGSTKQSHDPIAPELVDSPFIFVNFVHENLKASIHDAVYFLRVELLTHGGGAGQISKHYGQQFAFTFDCAAVCENFISQVFWGVRLRLTVIDRWGFLSCGQIKATLTAEVELGRV
jgi:hypothetical protein